MSTGTRSNRVDPGPDQAAGWAIALACFFINFICAGLARTAGVLYVALIELYGVSREAASTPFSIRVCVRNMIGPLIGLLGLRFGIRAVTVCGGFVAALGSILCYFAPDVMWITVFWGVIHGTGFGLSTVLHMMVIGLYFDKYKASALGLGYSGDCFGTFAFPVIMESLLATYDVQGTFLILGGIVLHVVPMAMLLRKPPWLELNRTTGNFHQNIARQKSLDARNNFQDTPVSYKKEAFANSNDAFGNSNKAFANSNETFGSSNKAFANSNEALGNLNKAFASSNEVFWNSNKAFANSNEEDLDSLGDSEGNRVPNGGFAIGEPPVYQEIVLRDRRVNCLRYESASMTGSLRSHGNRSDISEFIRENMDRHDSLPPVLERETGDDNMSGKFSINSGDVSLDLDISKSETASRRIQHSDSMRKPRTSSLMSQMAHEIVHRMRTASFASQAAQDGFVCNLQQEQKEEPKAEEVSPEVPQQDVYTLKNTTGLSLENTDAEEGGAPPAENTDSPGMFWTLVRTNTKPIFVLISLTMAAYAFLFVGVLTIIIDYAADQGIPQDKGKYLIIGFSVTDLVGRMTFGQVIDRKLVKMKNYAGVTTLLMGILVGVIPLNTSFNYTLVCMCLYGLVQGGTAIMFPILVSCYMEGDEESVAMGCLNFYGGLLMLCMAPMIGYFRDNTGSYNGVFYILGGLMAAIGLVWQFESPILKFQNRKLHRARAKFFLQSELSNEG